MASERLSGHPDVASKALSEPPGELLSSCYEQLFRVSKYQIGTQWLGDISNSESLVLRARDTHPARADELVGLCHATAARPRAAPAPDALLSLSLLPQCHLFAFMPPLTFDPADLRLVHRWLWNVAFLRRHTAATGRGILGDAPALHHSVLHVGRGR